MLGAGTPAFAQDITSPAPTGAVTQNQTAAWPIDGCYSIYSNAIGLWVRTNLTGSPYPLEARASTNGSWEQFCLQSVTGGWSIYVQGNKKYVSARLNLADHPLQAIADRVGPWETFQIFYYPDGTVNIYSPAAGQYVSAKLNSPPGYPLQANANSAGSWESFDIRNY